MKNNQNVLREEKGNVLFLILIAVALFAALSYAVTQSTRSGGSSTEREQSILSSAAMTQYPTALRTAIIRMVLGGIDVTQLEFNPPSDFVSLTDPTQGVFNSTGGGALFQQAPADLLVANVQGNWFYNINWQVPGIGSDTTGGDITGNDLIAFLPNVTNAVCTQTNREFTINTTGCTMSSGGVPVLNATNGDEAEIRILMDDGYSLPADAEILQATGCTAFSSQASGCFFDGAENIFYSVLLER